MSHAIVGLIAMHDHEYEIWDSCKKNTVGLPLDADHPNRPLQKRSMMLTLIQFDFIATQLAHCGDAQWLMCRLPITARGHKWPQIRTAPVFVRSWLWFICLAAYTLTPKSFFLGHCCLYTGLLISLNLGYTLHITWGTFHSRKRCQHLRTFANNFKWNELFAATVGKRWQL